MSAPASPQGFFRPESADIVTRSVGSVTGLCFDVHNDLVRTKPELSRSSKVFFIDVLFFPFLYLSFDAASAFIVQ